MSFKILPNEVQFTNTHSNVTVATKVPMEHLDDGLLIVPRVRSMGLKAGNVVTVQVMAGDYDRLVAMADFVIVGKTLERKRIETERSEQVVDIVNFTIERRTDWWQPKAETAAAAEKVTEPERRFIQGDGEVKWNLGKKVYQVMLGDLVVFETADKAEAQSIASGSAPIPDAAVKAA